MKVQISGGRGEGHESPLTLLPCECGEIPKMTLCYGRTPFNICCTSCKTRFENKITNCDIEGAIKHFNRWYLDKGNNPYEITPKSYAHVFPTSGENDDKETK